jgi:hypothetical protein
MMEYGLSDQFRICLATQPKPNFQAPQEIVLNPQKKWGVHDEKLNHGC